jgi:CheY-like chemotaxis protein
VDAADVLDRKILVVDDQQANVLLLEQMLRSGGYRAVSATTDPAKVARLHLVHRYDLILLDLQMPGRDGFQVLEDLRRAPSGLPPVLVVSAEPELRAGALQAGAQDFIAKPFRMDELLRRVQDLLQAGLLHPEPR